MYLDRLSDYRSEAGYQIRDPKLVDYIDLISTLNLQLLKDLYSLTLVYILIIDFLDM